MGWGYAGCTGREYFLCVSILNWKPLLVPWGPSHDSSPPDWRQTSCEHSPVKTKTKTQVWSFKTDFLFTVAISQSASWLWHTWSCIQSVTWKCPEPWTEKIRMMALFSKKALVSLVSLLGVVDQMPFCWEISKFLMLLLFIIKYRTNVWWQASWVHTGFTTCCKSGERNISKHYHPTSITHHLVSMTVTCAKLTCLCLKKNPKRKQTLRDSLVHFVCALCVFPNHIRCTVLKNYFKVVNILNWVEIFVTGNTKEPD